MNKKLGAEVAQNTTIFGGPGSSSLPSTFLCPTSLRKFSFGTCKCLTTGLCLCWQSTSQLTRQQRQSLIAAANLEGLKWEHKKWNIPAL